MPAASAMRVARAAHTYRLTATMTPRLIETPYADGPTILGWTLTQLCLEAAHSRSWAVAAPGQSRVVPAAGTSWNTRLGGSPGATICRFPCTPPMAFGNDWPDWRRMTTVPSIRSSLGGPFRPGSISSDHFGWTAGRCLTSSPTRASDSRLATSPSRTQETADLTLPWSSSLVTPTSSSPRRPTISAVASPSPDSACISRLVRLVKPLTMPVPDDSCSLTSGPTTTGSPLRLRPAKPSTERFCSLTRVWRSP